MVMCARISRQPVGAVEKIGDFSVILKPFTQHGSNGCLLCLDLIISPLPRSFRPQPHCTSRRRQGGITGVRQHTCNFHPLPHSRYSKSLNFAKCPFLNITSLRLLQRLNEVMCIAHSHCFMNGHPLISLQGLVSFHYVCPHPSMRNTKNYSVETQKKIASFTRSSFLNTLVSQSLILHRDPNASFSQEPLNEEVCKNPSLYELASVPTRASCREGYSEMWSYLPGPCQSGALGLQDSSPDQPPTEFFTNGHLLLLQVHHKTPIPDLPKGRRDPKLSPCPELHIFQLPSKPQCLLLGLSEASHLMVLRGSTLENRIKTEENYYFNVYLI